MEQLLQLRGSGSPYERSKRSVDNVRKEECKQLSKSISDDERTTEQFNVYSNGIKGAFDVAGNIASAVPALGSTVSAIVKGVGSTITTIMSFFSGTKKSHIYDYKKKKRDLRCDSIPMEEMRDAMSEGFKNIDQKIDRNYELLVENFELSKLNLEAANRNYQAIKRVYDFLEKEKFESATAEIINFFDVFSSLLDGMNNLDHDRLIEKLEAEDGTLVTLKSVRRRKKGNLYHDLKNIIRLNYAIPKSADDNMAFGLLDLLYSGTQLYTSVVHTLVKSYIFLAMHYYQKDNTRKYNSYLNELEITIKAFMDLGETDSLYRKLDETFEQVEELDFVTQEREDIVETLSKKRADIKRIESKLNEMIQSLPKNAPEYRIKFDFSVSNISTLYGKWKDKKEVRYAIHFQTNDGNYTKVGAWKSHQIRGKSNPLLRLGVAKEGQKRFIFRKFNKGKPELVGTIDSKQSEFRDLNKDLYNAVMNSDEELALDEIKLLLKEGADINAEYKNKVYIMHAAASQGNLNVTSTLIASGAKIEARDSDGNTPLHLATQHGLKNIVELLKEKGADVNAGNNLKFTPLHTAAKNGDADIFNLLIQKGANLNSTASNGFTPLHTAAKSGRHNIIDLMPKDVEINPISDKGLTPLHLASAAGHDLTVKSLLRRDKINVNARTEKGIAPLHLASMAGNLNTVKLLVAQKEKLKVNEKSNKGLSPLHLAIYSKHGDVAVELLSVKNIDISSRIGQGWTLLHIAAMRNQLKVLKALLNMDALPEERDDANQTPLHLAAEQGNLDIVETLVKVAKVALNVERFDGRTPLQLAIIGNRLSVVQSLIEKGARLYTTDKMGVSLLDSAIGTGKPYMVRVLIDAYKKKSIIFNGALHKAAYTGSIDVVKLLEELVKPNLNSIDERGNSAIQFAALGGGSAMIEYLEKQGAHLNTSNYDNMEPIHFACLGGQYDSIRYIMQKNNTDINKQDDKGNTPMHYLAASDRKDPYTRIVKFMVGKGANLDASNREGYRPLVEFARSGNWPVVRYLMKKGVSCNATSEQDSVLHFAIRDGEKGMIEDITKVCPDIINVRDHNHRSPVFWAAQSGRFDLVKLLIEDKKVNHTQVDRNGTTILHAAVLSDKLEIVKYLVEEKKYNPKVANSSINTPLSLAAQKGNLQIVDLLVKNEAERNSINTNGSTPLLEAASYKNWAVVKYLIKNGANTKIVDYNNNSLIHWCAEGGALEVMKSLEVKDFDINRKNSNGETALHLAVKNKHQDLVEYLFSKRGANLHEKDKLDNTPLHYAALNDNLTTVKYLMERGADGHSKNGADLCPFELCNDPNVVKYFIDEKKMNYTSNACVVVGKGSFGVLKYLEEKKSINLNMTDTGGKTLSHCAAEKGRLNMLKYLVVKKKADIHRKDESLKTPAQYALMKGHLDVYDYLYEMDNMDIFIDDIILAKAGGKKMLVHFNRKLENTNIRGQ